MSTGSHHASPERGSRVPLVNRLVSVVVAAEVDTRTSHVAEKEYYSRKVQLLLKIEVNRFEADHSANPAIKGAVVGKVSQDKQSFLKFVGVSIKFQVENPSGGTRYTDCDGHRILTLVPAPGGDEASRRFSLR